jgi:hypothetical protein
MNIQGLFPIPLGITNLNRSITNDEINFVKSLDFTKNKGNAVSASRYVLQSIYLTDIKSFILNNINLYLENSNPLPKNKDLEVYITQSWFNYTRLNEHHHKHYHHNSFISGVLYFDVNQETDSITFEVTYPHKTIGYIPDKWTPFNSETWNIPVKNGDLLLFPSTLIHFVKNKEDDRERLSLSFNTFLKGTLGESSDLTELIL